MLIICFVRRHANVNWILETVLASSPRRPRWSTIFWYPRLTIELNLNTDWATLADGKALKAIWSIGTAIRTPLDEIVEFSGINDKRQNGRHTGQRANIISFHFNCQEKGIHHVILNLFPSWDVLRLFFASNPRSLMGFTAERMLPTMV